MYMGYGVSGVCWRGKRIFEGPKSKAVVSNWVSWYKRFRSSLTAEAIIHVRRPDGQSIDAVLHANSRGGDQGERGILFAFNPTDATITGNLSLSLYYTGLTDVVHVTHEEDANGKPSGDGQFTLKLARDYSISVPIRIAANRYSWWILR